MRPRLPAALGCLALLAVPGLAAADLPAWSCIPEDPVCLPDVPAPDVPAADVLCPHLGSTFGWCVAPQAGAGQASLVWAAGNYGGPASRGSAGLSWADADGDGRPDPALAAENHADLCPPRMLDMMTPPAIAQPMPIVLLPEPLRTLPCEQDAAAQAGLQL